MSLLSSVAIRLLPFALVLRFGSNIVLGENVSSNTTKVCCPPFDKRVESNGKVFCFATITIPNDRATIGNYLCRNLHPHANLASFHSTTEVNAGYNFGPAVTGLQYEFDEYTWRDGTPVNFTQWAYGHPSMNSSDSVVELGTDGHFRTVTLQGSTSRKAFCKMEADHTECPECEKCLLFKTSQNSYCYQFVLSAGGRAGVRDAIENNICGKTYPGYESASIHSKEESEFILKHQPGYYYNLFIGLRVPPSKQSLPYEKKLFEWTDGTPVDFEIWGRDFPVNHTSPKSWHPGPYVCMSNGMKWFNLIYCTDWFQVVCKKSVKCKHM